MRRREDVERKRIERAKEIAAEVRDGVYQPPAFSAEDSFYPVRPKIKKDREEMARVYGGDRKDIDQG